MCPEHPCIISACFSVLWSISKQSIKVYYNELNIFLLKRGHWKELF